ncbi:MAG: fluoride efflux transporter CrcB [Pelagibacterales bacterium]|jgi:CrcB protein|nr:fluoride efflux transporter CrcB [Pelagibacterales bacterium]|tara:strand:- start:667 stop:1038 length:372 start_codon:yes stop_codon:yes gene_type:complete
MKNFLLVFIGGGFGSGLRYIIGRYLNSSLGSFPVGTFTVNIIGSLLIGLILGYAAKENSLNQNQVLLLATGFCGGFTTFSAFAHENFQLLKTGDIMQFSIYTISSIVVGLIAVFIGIYIAKNL